MNFRALKYILDIESIIIEIEQILQKTENNFTVYSNDFIIKRALERDLEIIGEAISKLIKLEPQLNLTNYKKIIGLRNLIIHSYDSIEDELIWSIVQKDIPLLKGEIIKLNYEFRLNRKKRINLRQYSRYWKSDCN
ncbi:MAG: DUF86 domain-containing protein [Flavobacteriales bacterium]|nr:DUF86 domain-containing protein [Flavobacteriales bacterium]